MDIGNSKNYLRIHELDNPKLFTIVLKSKSLLDQGVQQTLLLDSVLSVFLKRDVVMNVHRVGIKARRRFQDVQLLSTPVI